MSISQIILRHAPRRWVGVISGAALVVAAVVSGTTPARASNDDLIRFLLGAATVAVIVRSFNDRDPTPDRRYRADELPAHCAETLRVRRQHVTVYNAQCLSRAGVHNLPQRCYEAIPTNHGTRQVYRAQCLERSGYRVATTETRPHRPREVVPTVPHRPAAMWLPRECALNYRQAGRRIQGYDGACLQQAGLRRLPQSCAMEARNGNRRQTIYDADCLLSVGYRRR